MFCGSLQNSQMEDEYARLIRRMNSPRVCIDNDSCDHATVLEVVSSNRPEILLEVVQLLVELNHIIRKAYISSDGEWLMNVFNVTDCDGNKITNEGILEHVQKTLESDVCFLKSIRDSTEEMPEKYQTSIELSGADRPGLLSEVFAVLKDIKCNVVNAEIWTHNGRVAGVIYVTDQLTGHIIQDSNRLRMINNLLCNVLKDNKDFRTPKITFSSSGYTHNWRRLHQLMFADRDFERHDQSVTNDASSSTHVSVLDCTDRDYTVVTVRSNDRPNLLFDTLCSLTDMQYVVYHGTIVTGRMEAYQEYYVRHTDGLPMRSEAERQRVSECLEAAIERRATEVRAKQLDRILAQGLELELCTEDKLGLLSHVTRIFRENGLCIKRAEISTQSGKSRGTFLVSDVYGNSVEPKILDLIRGQIGQTRLRVKDLVATSASRPLERTRSFLFGNFFKGPNFQNGKLMKSYT